MTIYEACSFYGDYRILLQEVAEELSVEEVENTTLAASFVDEMQNFDIEMNS